MFEVFETKKSGILGHRKSSERFSAAGKKISSSLRRPLLKSSGLLFFCIKFLEPFYARGRIRTYEDTKSQDLKSCAFDHFATLAYIINNNPNVKNHRSKTYGIFIRCGFLSHQNCLAILGHRKSFKRFSLYSEFHIPSLLTCYKHVEFGYLKNFWCFCYLDFLT